MTLSTARWHGIAERRFPWERRALGYACVWPASRLCAVRRHSEIDVAPDIKMIDAIKRFDG